MGNEKQQTGEKVNLKRNKVLECELMHKNEYKMSTVNITFSAIQVHCVGFDAKVQS